MGSNSRGDWRLGAHVMVIYRFTGTAASVNVTCTHFCMLSRSCFYSSNESHSGFKVGNLKGPRLGLIWLPHRFQTMVSWFLKAPSSCNICHQRLIFCVIYPIQPNTAQDLLRQFFRFISLQSTKQAHSLIYLAYSKVKRGDRNCASANSRTFIWSTYLNG